MPRMPKKQRCGIRRLCFLVLDTEPLHKTETFPEQSVNANFNVVPH